MVLPHNINALSKTSIYRVFLVSSLVVLASCSRQPAVLSFVSDLHTPAVCGVLPNNPNIAIKEFAFSIGEVEVYIDEQWVSVPFLPSSLPAKQHSEKDALVSITPECDAGVQTQVHIPVGLSHHKFAAIEKLRFGFGQPVKEAPYQVAITLHNKTNNEQWRAQLRQTSDTQFTVDKHSVSGVILVQVLPWLDNIVLSADNSCTGGDAESKSCEQLMDNVKTARFTWISQK